MTNEKMTNEKMLFELNIIKLNFLLTIFCYLLIFRRECLQIRKYT